MKKNYQYLLDNILSSLTEDEKINMKHYYNFYEKREQYIYDKLENTLKDHAFFGELLRKNNKEDLKKMRQESLTLQRNAILNNEWQVYIESQAAQGIAYARMGVEFYMWYDLIAIFRNYTMKILLEEESKDQQEFLIILNGMNRYFDIAMSIIAEAYLNEKKSIIEEQKDQQEKLNKELKKTMDHLKEKNKDLEQFAYIASHDLQEPLRMVTSFLTQLEKKYKDQLDDKAQQYIFYAVDGATRMRRIILDLLEYSRVGRKEYELEPVDMNELLDEVIQLHHTLIEEKNAKVKSDKLPVINAARTPIQQVMQNLIGNALKYQQAGVEPSVEIKVSETEKHWQFSILDNGIGIDPQFFEKIFVLFQRLHNKDEFSGTGIGLAICKKIVEAHNGHIWVESSPGEGSIFHFTIGK